MRKAQILQQQINIPMARYAELILNTQAQ